MQTSIVDPESRHPAPCKQAHLLLICVVAISCLLVLVTGFNLLRQNPYEQAAAGKWMQTLALSTPAFWSAGSPMRHPETVHPGVDLRFAVGVEILP